MLFAQSVNLNAKSGDYVSACYSPKLLEQILIKFGVCIKV
jgi:hypothetical protein